MIRFPSGGGVGLKPPIPTPSIPHIVLPQVPLSEFLKYG